MTTTFAAKTAGQELADTLRQMFRVGTRTSRYGKVFGHRTDLHDAMVESIENANNYPGFYSSEKTEILHRAFAAAASYRKHVGGYRIDGMLAYRINALSAYRFAALLGRMVDAGVSNCGDGERFFADMAREAR